MVLRALAVWLLLLVLAVLNGGVRDTWLSPRLGAWAELLADYDLRRGRIWLLVLVVTFLAPWLTARVRGLAAGGGWTP